MDDGLLIDQVSSFPQLFVKSDPRYKNLRMKENAWKTIAAIVEETPEACERRWKILRNKYTSLKREQKNTPSGSGASEITWPYFELMRFLDPYLLTRKSYSNLSIKRKPDATEWDSMYSILDDDLSQEYEQNNSPESSFVSEAGTSTSIQTPKQTKTSSSVIQRQTVPAKSLEDTSSQSIKQKRTLSNNIPRHTIPSKKQKTDILADKMTGCFDSFQKVLESNTSQSPTQTEEHFVRSLVQDMKVFSPTKIILIKREFYNVMVKHLEPIDDDSD